MFNNIQIMGSDKSLLFFYSYIFSILIHSFFFLPLYLISF